MNANEVLRYHGNRPLWKSILAALLLTVALLSFYTAFFTRLDTGEHLDPSFKGILVFVGFWFAVYGWHNATTYEYYIDLKQRRYKIIDRVGPFSWGKWKDLVDVKSLTISKIKKGDYEVELIFHGKKKFLILRFGELDEAMSLAREMAGILEIELIDLTA